MADGQMTQDDLKAWQESMLQKAETPEGRQEVMNELKTILGEQLFEKVAGGAPAPKPPPQQKPQQQISEAEDDPVVRAARVFASLNEIDQRIEQGLAMSAAAGSEVEGEVREQVKALLKHLDPMQRAEVTAEEVATAAEYLAGKAYAERLKAGKAPQSQEAKPPTKESGGEQNSETPTMPDYMKAPRDQIMAMKDALLSSGFTESEIEAMCL